MVGLVENLKKKMTLDFKSDGDPIFLLGSWRNDINSSEYLRQVHGILFSPAPAFDLEEEYKLQQLIAGLIRDGWIRSAHDISEGGLLITLMEKGWNRKLGFDVRSAEKDVDGAPIRKDAFWLGEGQSRVVVTLADEKRDGFIQFVNRSGIPFMELGRVTDGSVKVDDEDWGVIGYCKELYDTAIEKHLARELESEGALGMI
jgi:phosphoribosylformylglycinamidine synthase